MQQPPNTASEYSVVKHMVRFIPVKGWALCAKGTLQKTENHENHENAASNDENGSYPRYFHVANANLSENRLEMTKVPYRIYR